MVFAWMMTFDGADGSLEAAPSMMKGGHPSLVAVLPFPAPLLCPVNCLKGVSIVPSSPDYASKEAITEQLNDRRWFEDQGPVGLAYKRSV